MRSRTKLLAAVVAVLSVGLPATAGADQDTKQVKTEVRLLEVNRTTFMEFTGKIGSQKPCVGDRLVTLWYMPSEGSPAQKLGTDRTNKKGRFDIDLSSPAVMGFYAAAVKKATEDGNDEFDEFLCKGVRGAFVRF